MKLPEGFLVGTATAAYQIEGAWAEDGKGESVWDRFSHTPGKVKTGETGDVACDHYHRWKEDVELMGSMGLNAYRFSVSWPRVMPKGRGQVNEKGIQFYSRLVDALLAKGIRPLVTLYHWDLPQALEDEGGWVNRDIAGWFGDYAELLAKRLGDRVKDWITLNEPTSFIWGGHINGGSAPDRKDRRLGLSAAHNANRAHGVAVRALRAAGGKGTRVGVSLNNLALKPASDSPEDVAATNRIDAKKNLLFTDPMLRGEYPQLVLDVMPQLKEWIKPGDTKEIFAPLDFVGVNYYHYLIVKNAPAGQSAAKGTGAAPMYGFQPSGESAEVLTNPQGLRDVLVRYKNEYGVKEMIVTENGMSRPEDAVAGGRVADKPRIDFLRGHIEAGLKAREQDGCNLTGFCMWSFMDNFEWASGFGPRFGIVHVDYKTQKRTIKDSGKWYSRCAKERRLVEA